MATANERVNDPQWEVVMGELSFDDQGMSPKMSKAFAGVFSNGSPLMDKKRRSLELSSLINPREVMAHHTASLLKGISLTPSSPLLTVSICPEIKNGNSLLFLMTRDQEDARGTSPLLLTAQSTKFAMSEQGSASIDDSPMVARKKRQK